MTEIPKEGVNNPLIEGLSNLAYDDSPENNAQNLNDQGNTLIRKYKTPKDIYYLKQAVKAYDDGLLQECNDNRINAKLYSNRAMCNMKLKNYGKVIDDC